MRPSKSVLFKGGLLVTMNAQREIASRDLLIENGKISRIAKSIRTLPLGCQVVDVADQFVIPGLIQNHIHLCQTLFRGEADDLALLTWLSKKIWPMEKHHTARSLQASARLSLLELQRSGTTTILDMGTVAHTDALLEAVAESGLRYWGGKCLMDDPRNSMGLGESSHSAIRETESLIRRWEPSKSDALIHYALCPRFAISCSRELLEACASLQKTHQLKIHTHASESPEEIQLVKKMTGMGNIEYFKHLNILNPHTILAHGVHLSNKDVQMLVKAQCPIVHCPSSNLKLGSGIAPIHYYCQCGLTIGLGADGAPCNNTLDPFKEMLLAAVLQKPKFGPEAMPAIKAFEMATITGARVLGQEKNIGSLEVGKSADLVVVDRSHPSVATVEQPYSALVYSCTGRDVLHTMTMGRFTVYNRRSTWCDEEEAYHIAKKEKRALIKRIEGSVNRHPT